MPRSLSPIAIATAAILVGSIGLTAQPPAQPGTPGRVVRRPQVVEIAQPSAQPATPGRGGRGPQGPVVVSPELQSDHHVVFRLLAPRAESVELRGGDLTAGGRTLPTMTKGENGVWEAAMGPLDPGAYRYNFMVGGAQVLDPRNTSVSETNSTVQSLLVVPGSDTVPGSNFMDTRNVPHGAVASVFYNSTSLGRTRRMHIYTPPGYETGRDKYPVFYLLHGAGDCDDSWTSVGRAGFVMDNLIEAKKAKPMIVVMPAGHTVPGAGGGRGRGAGGRDEFTDDFLKDIVPYVETHYRVLADRPHRAIAGLSMGGSQTLNIAIPNLEKFAYVGVYSSGLIGAFGGGRGPVAAPASPAAAPVTPAGPSWEEQHHAELDNAGARKGLKLVWFSTGVDDGLMSTTKSTVEMLKKHGFSPVFKESPGAHTWINWRNYLGEFAPQLFQ